LRAREPAQHALAHLVLVELVEGRDGDGALERGDGLLSVRELALLRLAELRRAALAVCLHGRASDLSLI
jgi:ADP-ribose pyrophosphatase YjhB (NUDIX family)